MSNEPTSLWVRVAWTVARPFVWLFERLPEGIRKHIDVF